MTLLEDFNTLRSSPLFFSLVFCFPFCSIRPPNYSQHLCILIPFTALRKTKNKNKKSNLFVRVNFATTVDYESRLRSCWKSVASSPNFSKKKKRGVCRAFVSLINTHLPKSPVCSTCGNCFYSVSHRLTVSMSGKLQLRHSYRL